MKRMLVVFCAILLTCVISCGKDNEGVAKKAGQPKKFGNYDVIKGEMLKGGISGGYILKSDDTSFLAMRNIQKKHTDKVSFKVMMKAHQQKGTRNGFIRARTDADQIIEAGVLIGAGKYVLSGNAVEKQEIAVKFDKNKLFMIELVIDIRNKEVTARIDDKALKSKIKAQFKEIKRIGYFGHKAQTEFTEIEEVL